MPTFFKTESLVAKTEVAATSQQLPREPWLTSPEDEPSTKRRGDSQISKGRFHSTAPNSWCEREMIIGDDDGKW